MNIRLEKLLRSGKVPDMTCWLDCYNQKVDTEVAGTILCGINYRNMHFVQVEYVNV